MSVREFMVLLTMCMIWGLHFVVIKIGVGQIPPLFYAALRMSLVALIMLPFLRWRPGQMVKVALAALCFGSLNYAFLFSGLARTPASVAALALELYVPFATILSMIFLGDRFGIKRGAGIILAIAGVALIALAKDDTPGADQYGFGIFLLCCGALVEAIGAILVKKINGLKPVQLLAWFALIGSITLWIATLILEPGAYQLAKRADPWTLVGAIFYSAIAASIIGHTSYYWLLQRLPVSVVAPSGLVTTLLAVIFSVLLLGERLTPVMMVGALLLLMGVGVILIRNNRKSVTVAPVDHGT